MVKLIARVRVRRASRQRDQRQARKRTKRVLIGKRRFSIPAGRTKVVRVRLRRRGRALLRHARRHRLKVQLRGRGVRNRTVVLKQVRRGNRTRKRR